MLEGRLSTCASSSIPGWDRTDESFSMAGDARAALRRGSRARRASTHSPICGGGTSGTASSSARAISRAVAKRSLGVAREPAHRDRVERGRQTPARRRSAATLHAGAAPRRAPRASLSPREEAPARERLPEHDRRRVDVGRARRRVPRSCSGAMYGELALELPLARASAAGPTALATPKSSTRAHAVDADQDVLRGDVAVDDVERLAALALGLVRRVQPVQHARHDAWPTMRGRDALASRRADGADQPRERLAVHVLHDEEQLALHATRRRASAPRWGGGCAPRGAPRRGTSRRTRGPRRAAGAGA